MCMHTYTYFTLIRDNSQRCPKQTYRLGSIRACMCLASEDWGRCCWWSCAAVAFAAATFRRRNTGEDLQTAFDALAASQPLSWAWTYMADL